MKFIHPKSTSHERPRTALILTHKEWSGMIGAANEGQKQQEMLEELVHQRAAKKEKCQKSTEKWPNTLASIQKLRQNQLVESKRQAEEKKLEDYKSIIDEREKERQLTIQKAKELLFERSDYCRTIKTGVMLSAILEEREKQIDLANQLKQRMLEKELEDTALRRVIADKYEQEVKQKKIDHIRQMDTNRKLIDEQMKEVYLRRQADEEEKKREKRDSDNLRKELEEEKLKEAQVKLEKQNKLRKEQEEWTRTQAKLKERRMNAEKNFDEMNEIYQSVRDKLNQARTDKERELRVELMQRTSLIPVEMLPKKADFTKEQALLEKVLKEQAERLDREHMGRMQKLEKSRQELLKFEKEAIEQSAEKCKRRAEERRFEILQRMAIEESDKQWREKQQQNKRQKQRETRDELVRLWEEREKTERESRWDDMSEYHRAQVEEQNMVLRYCEQVEKSIAESGRPMHPVEAAIAKVKKSAGLLSKEKTVPFLKSRVPIQSVAIYQK